MENCTGWWIVRRQLCLNVPSLPFLVTDYADHLLHRPVVLSDDQASFDNDIRAEVILSRFHGFHAFEERGHHYELWVDSRQGRISATYIDGTVRGGVRDKLIFFCGPSPMVAALASQFRALGVLDEQFVIEDFNLL